MEHHHLYERGRRNDLVNDDEQQQQREEEEGLFDDDDVNDDVFFFFFFFFFFVSPDHVFVQMFSSWDVFDGDFFPGGFVHHQSRLTKIPFAEKNRVVVVLVVSSFFRSGIIKDGRVFRVVFFGVLGSSIVVSIGHI